MKSKGLLIVLILLSVLGYFLYPLLSSSKNDVRVLIPETAAISIKVNNPKVALAQFRELNWYEAFKSVPLLRTLESALVKIDSLERAQTLSSKISELPLWISLHTTSSDDLSPLFILQSNGFEWNGASLKSIMEQLVKGNIVSSTQNFNDKEILTFQSDQFNLSTLIEGSYLAFSTSTVLVEDVVRAMEEPQNRLIQLNQDFGGSGDLSIVLNSSRLQELNAVFFESMESLAFRNPSDQNLFVNIDLENRQLTFNGSGKANGSSVPPSAASIFAENLVPIAANKFSWRPIEIASNLWKDLLNGDLCNIEIGKSEGANSRVLLFSSTDTTQLRNTLDALALENLQPSDSAVYKERYVSSDIGFINNNQTLEGLMRDAASEVQSPYYAILQGFLIISDDLDALKMVLNDFDNERTWGRSVDRRRIIDDMIQETDLTIVQDFEFATDPLKNRLKPKWKTFFDSNPEILSALSLLKLQVNRTKANILISGDVTFNDVFDTPSDYASDLKDLIVKANVFADAELTTKPYVVRNHNDASLEVIFQDADNQLYLTDKQGEILWKKGINGTLKGDIHQIDFYNNKKLQYLMFTDSLIHLIDRNGKEVDGFPIGYGSSLPFEGTSVVDYDNNKRYRYLTRDRRGNLYLYGKEGEPLDGWQPKAIGNDLLQTPFHVRVRGRDCFVVVETSGQIHLLNRRGDEYAGFPLNIGKRLSGETAFVKGSNFGQSLISLSTVDGELVQVDLNGRVVTRKQLLRASGSEFNAVSDALETTFSIVRNDGRKLVIFDNKGEERFSIDFPNSKSIKVDQYNFRNGKEIFAIRDVARQTLRLIDREGRLLTSEIPASSQASILFYQNRLEYEVFVNFADQLNIYAVKPL
ncbi:hypothetical protein [Roseivirga sp. E12]|uniref:hypothetical protein n=1 Tax=Roseivirga sp. E12 TaxID=2819237 RepID=UPI001ABCD958|nr:hypothetical protein [Roseivirga sp. E12]MBO3700460.1 hypothetical protein [Roseivirga sp. E12]